jgi:hypothetical protein
MGLKRSFILITTAAVAAPSIASAQEQTVFVTGAMQDREQRVTVLGAAQDREQRVTVIGAAQDREQRVTVIGAADDQRPSARPAASQSLPTIPVVYEDEPAPAPASAPTRAGGQAPTAQPNL